MSADEHIPTNVGSTGIVAAAAATDPVAEKERSEKILKAKELYIKASRSFLIKNCADAADQFSEVCGLYEELYGELSDEIGMPYLFYAKALIGLAVDENKLIDMPDEEEDDDDDDDDEEYMDDNDEAAANDANAADVDDDGGKEVQNGKPTSSSPSSSSSGLANDVPKKLETIKEMEKKSDEEADSTENGNGEMIKEQKPITNVEKVSEETEVTSSNDDDPTSDKGPSTSTGIQTSATTIIDSEKPSTSNGVTTDNAEEDDEAASNLQLAWEILELAAKIFKRQGANGLANLAEVKTELANIAFENSILESARVDYNEALKIYEQLPTANYRRAIAEIHYKIGLTYLMQQMNKEGAQSLKEACKLLDVEIEEIKTNNGDGGDSNDKNKNHIQDLEETKQEIWAKIAEIEEAQAQNAAVRAALDSYIKPISSSNGASTSTAAGASSSTSSSSTSSSSTISSSSKPTDITHLIKRKKTDDRSSEAEAAESPAKRQAL